MNFAFALKDLGALDYFLGIEIQKLPNGSLLLVQSKYIKDLLQKFHMDNMKSLPTPMVGGCKLIKHEINFLVDAKLYRSLAGALQYITITRPEISYNISKASAPNDRKSNFGACVYLAPNLVSWWSKKQEWVARSMTEAKYRNLTLAASEMIWIQSLLQELQFKTSIPVVYCDNMSNVLLSRNLVADILTKSLSTSRFLLLRDQLHVIDMCTAQCGHDGSKFRGEY
ncbi:PREDICTED: uncharacterized protein LOC109344654 [Lupinus angustifolius]|uniref:uncharacterized protein LOC109344654 n=1 Tax=Lupinus angustifolius TaxID=3871 RepID=UPI00092E9DF3|nr:PREDICTED: uncharacterized protein LOC109344654 [Lupinus angustifolius]